MNPCKKITYIFDADFVDKNLIFYVLEILNYLNRLYAMRVNI